MPSGTISGTTTNDFITCKLVWDAVSDEATNSSHVTVELWLRKSKSSSAHTTGTGHFRLSFFGGYYNWNPGTIDIPNDGVWRKKKTWDFGHITHDANGARSIAMSLVNTDSGGSPYYSGLHGTTYTHSYCHGTAVLATFAPPAEPPEEPEPPVDPDPTGEPQTITQPHQVHTTGLVQKVVFTWPVGSMGNDKYPPHAHIFHHPYTDGSWSFEASESIYDGELTETGSGVFEVVLNHPVTASDHVIAVMSLDHGPITVGDAWAIDFSETQQTDADNTWTCLGYADNQLVGMTANHQIWTGDLGDYVLANAAEIAQPDALDIAANLAVVDAAAAPMTIHKDGDGTEHYRHTIRYTLVNKYGPTTPSEPLTFYCSKAWTEWTSANFIRVSGTAPLNLGVVAVDLYFTADESQEPAFLGRVTFAEELAEGDPGYDENATTKPWSFNWIGQADTSAWVAASLTAPKQNFTTGVPASKLAVLDGRLYFWGGTDPYRIWVGGGPGSRFSVSPGTGGGFVDVEPGVGTEVKSVLKFKTQQGAAIVTALCDNPNSQRENRYNLVESSLSLSDTQSSQGLMAEKIAGAVGCKSSNGAVAAGDGLYAVSRYGLAITTLTMEYNSQLQIMYVSDPIEPVFLKQEGYRLDEAVLFAANGVLYMTFGVGDGTLDNVVFCYDIALKAWWTYTLDLDPKEPILNMIHIDFDGTREGIGIITAGGVYLLPTTMDEAFEVLPEHEILIEFGALTTMQPLQSMHHLTQLEFRFDYFIGDLDIKVIMIDQFGRKIITTRTMTTNDGAGNYELRNNVAEYIRIDAVVESYKVVLQGKAKMRLTHFLAKLYPKSNRIGMVYGFDSAQSQRLPDSDRAIRRTFASYNDVKEAIIP